VPPAAPGVAGALLKGDAVTGGRGYDLLDLHDEPVAAGGTPQPQAEAQGSDQQGEEREGGESVARHRKRSQ
jgi:hypothetical protein